jgi:hypothetical protein
MARSTPSQRDIAAARARIPAARVRVDQAQAQLDRADAQLVQSRRRLRESAALHRSARVVVVQSQAAVTQARAMLAEGRAARLACPRAGRARFVVALPISARVGGRDLLRISSGGPSGEAGAFYLVGGDTP